ncbi:PilW family protein [Luteimonas sp. SMYT11W]|uniref:PilW family protein n=1 Tax=Luteimonas flava TaxID=3115822 RepID=A0ABU7W9U8_9GAMM
MIANRERGVSLIELMVALAIGTLLILGLVQVFGASRTAYQLSSGLGRVQENGRFALDLLQRDIRMAGHMGCVNDQARFLPTNVTASRPALLSTFLTAAQQFGTGASPTSNYAAAPFPLRFDVAIQGYNAVGTASGNTLALPSAPALATANTWEPQIEANLYTTLTSGTGAGRLVDGSDVLVLRYFAPTGAQVTAFTSGAPTSITVAQPALLTEGGPNSGLFGIADCMQVGVFAATVGAGGTLSVATTALNRTTFDTIPQFTIGQAMVYRAESIVYYIGRNASGNPALYRLRYGANAALTAVTAGAPEEMVEGIESMQFQFGQDSQTSASARPTGNIGQSVLPAGLQPAGNLDHAWRTVGLVQVGLLARSPDSAAAERRADATMRLSALGVIMAPPDDRRYRTVYEDSIALRNRLFGN